MNTRTIQPIKCTCPRLRYSPACRIESHRAIANDVSALFSGTGRHRRPRGVGKGSYRRRDWKACATDWLANLFNAGSIQRGILAIGLGLVLLAVGINLYQRANDTQSLKQIIHSQVEAAKLKEQNRDLDMKVRVLTNTNAELMGNGNYVPYIGGAK